MMTFSNSNPGRGRKRRCTELTSTFRPRAADIETKTLFRKCDAGGRRTNSTATNRHNEISTRLERNFFNAPPSMFCASEFDRRNEARRAPGTRAAARLLFAGTGLREVERANV